MMMNATDSKTIKKATTTLVVASLLTGAFAIQAVAAQPMHDEFHSSGMTKQEQEAAARREQIRKATTVQENPLGKQGALAMMSNPNDPIVQWFEKLDQTVYAYSKTQSEGAILSRGFNQEVERVQQYTDTAKRVAEKYRKLAGLLRKMDIPLSNPDLRDYRELVADWYSDSASIYEDLIKPRRAARTMEELDDGLGGIEARAKGLAGLNKRLYAMDVDLRMKYHVHMREQSDPLQKYVKGNPTKEEIQRVGGQLPR